MGKTEESYTTMLRGLKVKDIHKADRAKKWGEREQRGSSQAWRMITNRNQQKEGKDHATKERPTDPKHRNLKKNF